MAMIQDNIKAIGILVGLTWFVAVITSGWYLFEYLAERFGDTFGALSVLYLLGCVLVLFIGRALLERILVATLLLNEEVKQTWTSATVSPVQKSAGLMVQFSAVAALTISSASGTQTMMDHTRFFDLQIPTSTSST